MRRVFTILAFALFTVNVFAQPPEKMSYQAVIRNQQSAGNKSGYSYKVQHFARITDRCCCLFRNTNSIYQ